MNTEDKKLFIQILPSLEYATCNDYRHISFKFLTFEYLKQWIVKNK
jgi:hypothetical protein